MIKDLDQYKDDYISEVKGYIDLMNHHLLQLEKNPEKFELLDEIFRQAHTIKSMAAIMEYNETAKFCHILEDVLDVLRHKKLKLEDCIDVLFKAFDMLSQLVADVQNNKKESNTEQLTAELKTIFDVAAKIPKKAEPLLRSKSKNISIEKVRSIEVKIEKLDSLMNLAEEFIVNKMRLENLKDRLKNVELSAAVEHLSRLVDDMQYIIMQSRLVPIDFVFKRFPRMIRDMAKNQHKDINLQMRGNEIELDRVVIDEIGESLVHILKNAVDHGIETQAARKKIGKSEQGTINLLAKREKNSVVIEVMDDGGGLNLKQIKTDALKRGIIAANANSEEIMRTIFTGVSTTKQVTATSGRGLGLNIVRDKIESLGGTIAVESVEKEGTKFIIEVPLTMAVIGVLFIKVGAELFAIPVANVERLVTVNQEDIKGMMNFEAILLEDEEVPITRLNVLFDLPISTNKKQSIVIVNRNDQRLGLVVDSFLITQEIVIKPLNKLVKENQYFAGSTIIGTGEVVLILDVSNLMLSQRECAASVS